MNHRNAGFSPQAKDDSGIFYGFIIAIAAFFILFAAYGVRFSYGVFFKPMAEQLGFNAALTSAAYSISYFLEGVFSLISGGLADRFGPRIVVSVSSILVGLGYCLMPLVHSPWQLFIIYGVIVGVGMGAMFVPLVSMMARWFNARRNLITGMVSSGAGAGMLVIPPATARLINSCGWRTSYVIMGVIIITVILAAAQLLKRDPSEIGAAPYGNAGKSSGGDSIASKGHSLKEALRMPQFWVIVVMMFWFGAFAMSYNVHIVPNAIHSGMNPSSAADIMAATGALLIVGRILLAGAADKTGTKPVFILCFALSAGAFLFAAFVPAHWAFFLLAACIGFAQGGIGTSQSPLAASIFGLQSHGLILGCIGFGLTIGAAVGPFFTGLIYDLTGSYHIALLLCGASSITSLIFATFVKSDAPHR